MKLPFLMLLIGVVLSTTPFSVRVSSQSRSQATQAEADALSAVNLATNPTTKLAAAEEFFVRFPRSNSRLKIAELVTAELRKVRNFDAALILVERAQTIFTAPAEQELLRPIVLEAYVNGSRTDEAFRLAAELLARNPNELEVLMLMTSAGAEEARKKNRKHERVSQQYGTKAIALIESGQKPSTINAETWANYQSRLGPLYQQTAILYLGAGDTAEAKERLTRAANLRPRDPTNFALLGRVLNSDYEKQLTAAQSLPEGKTKEVAVQKSEETLDAIIDAYARATALATGQPEYQQLIQQLVPDLTAYYKKRHNQTTVGLQELINRYRAP